MAKSKSISTDSGKSTTKKVVKPTKGMVSVKFLKDFGSYKKKDVASYNITTVSALIDKKIYAIVE